MINHEFISKLKRQPKHGMATPPDPPDWSRPPDPTAWDAFTSALSGATTAIKNLTSMQASNVRGASILIETNQALFRSYTDLAKQQLWLEKRNSDLNKTFGLTVKQAAAYGQTLDNLSRGFKKGGDELRKYAINLQKVIGNYQLKDDAFSAQLLRTQEIITSTLGLTAEQAANFEFFAQGANAAGTDYLVTTNAIAKDLEGITGEAGLFKQITADMSDLSADLQMHYSRIPGTLEVATVKARRLGMSISQLNKAGENLLNIEQSIGQELEYQLLSGRRLVDTQGKSLTNSFREAQLRGDASKQADIMNKILDQEGETLEHNLFARKQMSQLLGMDEASLARALQKKKILEKIGGEALFEQSGKELFENAKALGASAEDLATLSEEKDTRGTEDILASIEKKLITEGIRVNIPDQANVVSTLSADILTASSGLSKLVNIGGEGISTFIGYGKLAADVTSKISEVTQGIGEVILAYETAGASSAAFTAIRSLMGATTGSANWQITGTGPKAVTTGTGGVVEGAKSGGPVAAGRPYLVGELGPELFVPKSAGTIVPNNQMAANTNNTDINALANAIVSALQNAKFEVKMDSTFSGGGMNNPRYM
jgi:hypothetical protein